MRILVLWSWLIWIRLHFRDGLLMFNHCRGGVSVCLSAWVYKHVMVLWNVDIVNSVGGGSLFRQELGVSSNSFLIMVVYDNYWQYGVWILMSSECCGDIVMWPDLFVFYDDLVHVLSLVFDALFIHRSVRYDVLIFNEWVIESMCVDENRWGLAKVHSLSRPYAVGSSVPFEIVFCWAHISMASFS